MGLNMALSYAHLFMEMHDKATVYTNILLHQYARVSPRYIDDLVIEKSRSKMGYMPPFTLEAEQI